MVKHIDPKDVTLACESYMINPWKIIGWIKKYIVSLFKTDERGIILAQCAKLVECESAIYDFLERKHLVFDASGSIPETPLVTIDRVNEAVTAANDILSLSNKGDDDRKDLQPKMSEALSALRRTETFESYVDAGYTTGTIIGTSNRICNLCERFTKWCESKYDSDDKMHKEVLAYFKGMFELLLKSRYLLSSNKKFYKDPTAGQEGLFSSNESPKTATVKVWNVGVQFTEITAELVSKMNMNLNFNLTDHQLGFSVAMNLFKVSIPPRNPNNRTYVFKKTKENKYIFEKKVNIYTLTLTNGVDATFTKANVEKNMAFGMKLLKPIVPTSVVQTTVEDVLKKTDPMVVIEDETNDQ